MHTISTKTDKLETTYNYKGVNVSVIEMVKKDIHTGDILNTKTYYECNCKVFYKLEDVESFIEDVFFSGNDRVISTDTIKQGESRLMNTEHSLSYKKDCIIKDAKREGLDVTFINKNAIELAVYREEGCINVVHTSPVEPVFTKIITTSLQTS